MILETEVKKQGNSNVIILPKKLGFKPKEKVRVLIMKGERSTVRDIGGMFRQELKKTDTVKTLKQIKEELWGE